MRLRGVGMRGGRDGRRAAAGRRREGFPAVRSVDHTAGVEPSGREHR